MYDWPERRAEVDAEWAELRDRLLARGIAAPQELTRRNADMPAVPGGIRDAEGTLIAPDPAMLPPDELDVATLWRHPRLLVSQTCWGPMETTGLASQVRVVGQPDYSAFEGGEGEFYRSAIVMRAGALPPSGLPAISPSGGEIGRHETPRPFTTDANAAQRRRNSISPLEGEMAGRPEGGAISAAKLIRGLRFAFNERHSMSGYLALARDLAKSGIIAEEDAFPAFWSAMVETHAHRASVLAVAEGGADVAAIDCQTWAYCRRYEPAAAALAVIGWTAPRMGLPFITAKDSPLKKL